MHLRSILLALGLCGCASSADSPAPVTKFEAFAFPACASMPRPPAASFGEYSRTLWDGTFTMHLEEGQGARRWDVACGRASRACTCSYNDRAYCTCAQIADATFTNTCCPGLPGLGEGSPQ